MSLNVNVTSGECAWADFQIKLLGRTIKGILGFSLKEEQEVEEVYGAGADALDLNSGNAKRSGSLTVLGFESDAMVKIAKQAGYNNITDVPHDAVVMTVSFRKLASDPITTYTASGIKFTEWSIGMKQNDKHRETELPFKCMNIS